MLRTLKRTVTNRTVRQDVLGVIRSHIAEAMVGRAVDLLVDAQHITHGVVAGVLNEAGKPKLLVDGHRYDLNQILTVMPASFN